jgi:hypothetical protein
MAYDERKAPKLSEKITWIYHRLGIPGLVGLVLLGAAWYVWTHWDKVKIWPGVGTMVTYWTRSGVPQADPERYAVMMAHLENDDKGQHERLRVEALKEFDGVQVLALDRSIPPTGPVPEESERRAEGGASKGR